MRSGQITKTKSLTASLEKGLFFFDTHLTCCNYVSISKTKFFFFFFFWRITWVRALWFSKLLCLLSLKQFLHDSKIVTQFVLWTNTNRRVWPTYVVSSKVTAPAPPLRSTHYFYAIFPQPPSYPLSFRSVLELKVDSELGDSSWLWLRCQSLTKKPQERFSDDIRG